MYLNIYERIPEEYHSIRNGQQDQYLPGPNVKLTKSYHEVGVGNVLRNHSWNIGGYLRMN